MCVFNSQFLVSILSFSCGILERVRGIENAVTAFINCLSLASCSQTSIIWLKKPIRKDFKENF